MTNRPLINEALRLVRHYWGYSQSEISGALGVSQSLISDVETGRKSVSMDLLQRYSEVLGIRMSQLLFFAEEIEDEPIQRRGKLLVAEKIIKLLDAIKAPGENAEA